MKDLVEFINKQGFSESRRVFGFDDETLKTYLIWSAMFNFLFLDLDEYGISGLGVAYPVKKRFNNDKEWFYSFKELPSKEEESDCDLCIMDFIATTPASKKNIINSFKTRFPNWESQKKYALVRNVPKEITNKHINLLYKYGSR